MIKFQFVVMSFVAGYSFFLGNHDLAIWITLLFIAYLLIENK